VCRGEPGDDLLAELKRPGEFELLAGAGERAQVVPSTGST